MIIADCIACRYGHHERHKDVPSASVPGLIGSGHQCHCKGDCAERYRPPVLPPIPRRGDHRPDPLPCALCNGDGDICNPGNADPAVKVTDWLAPIGCPRCGQTGKDPNP